MIKGAIAAPDNDPNPLVGVIAHSATALLNVFDGNERFPITSDNVFVCHGPTIADTVYKYSTRSVFVVDYRIPGFLLCCVFFQIEPKRKPCPRHTITK